MVDSMAACVDWVTTELMNKRIRIEIRLVIFAVDFLALISTLLRRFLVSALRVWKEVGRITWVGFFVKCVKSFLHDSYMALVEGYLALRSVFKVLHMFSVFFVIWSICRNRFSSLTNLIRLLIVFMCNLYLMSYFISNFAVYLVYFSTMDRISEGKFSKAFACLIWT